MRSIFKRRQDWYKEQFEAAKAKVVEAIVVVEEAIVEDVVEAVSEVVEEVVPEVKPVEKKTRNKKSE